MSPEALRGLLQIALQMSIILFSPRLSGDTCNKISKVSTHCGTQSNYYVSVLKVPVMFWLVLSNIYNIYEKGGQK